MQTIDQAIFRSCDMRFKTHISVSCFLLRRKLCVDGQTTTPSRRANSCSSSASRFFTPTAPLGRPRALFAEATAAERGMTRICLGAAFLSTKTWRPSLDDAADLPLAADADSATTTTAFIGLPLGALVTLPSTGVTLFRNRILFGSAASVAKAFALNVRSCTRSPIFFLCRFSAFSVVGSRIGAPLGSALGYRTVEANDTERPFDLDRDLGSPISAATFA